MERCLWAIGFLALAGWFAVWFHARQRQAEGNQELDRRLETARAVKPAHGAVRLPPPSRPRQGDLVGRIEIPRLQISTVVFEGTNDDVLGVGVGHLSGSPLPGERGNVVLAAHRDTYFRSLRNIRKYDAIDVVTLGGTRRYIVDSTMIVTPDHVEVLKPTPRATLTLITCYPFDWFGHAPKRFIVSAHEMSVPRKPTSLRKPTSIAKSVPSHKSEAPAQGPGVTALAKTARR
jgi:sortase A